MLDGDFDLHHRTAFRGQPQEASALEEANEFGISPAATGGAAFVDDDELSRTMARSVQHQPGETHNLYYPETTTMRTTSAPVEANRTATDSKYRTTTDFGNHAEASEPDQFSVASNQTRPLPGNHKYEQPQSFLLSSGVDSTKNATSAGPSKLNLTDSSQSKQAHQTSTKKVRKFKLTKKVSSNSNATSPQTKMISYVLSNNGQGRSTVDVNRNKMHPTPDWQQEQPVNMPQVASFNQQAELPFAFFSNLARPQIESSLGSLGLQNFQRQLQSSDKMIFGPQRFLMPMTTHLSSLTTTTTTSGDSGWDRRPSSLLASNADDLQTQTSSVQDSAVKGPFQLERDNHLMSSSQGTARRPPQDPIDAETSAEVESNAELMPPTGPSPSISPVDSSDSSGEPNPDSQSETSDGANDDDDDDQEYKTATNDDGHHKHQPASAASTLQTNRHEQPSNSSRQVAESSTSGAKTNKPKAVGHELLVGPFRSEAEAPATITLAGVVYQKSGSSSALINQRPTTTSGNTVQAQDSRASLLPSGSSSLTSTTSQTSQSDATRQQSWPFPVNYPSTSIATSPSPPTNNNIILGTVKSPADEMLEALSGQSSPSNIVKSGTKATLTSGTNDVSVGHQLASSSSPSSFPSTEFTVFPSGFRGLGFGGASLPVSLLSDLANLGAGGGGIRGGVVLPTPTDDSVASNLAKHLTSAKLMQLNQLSESGGDQPHETLSSSPSGQDPRGTTTIWMKQLNNDNNGKNVASSGQLDATQLVASESKKHAKEKAQPIVIVQKDVKPVKYHLLRAYLKLRRLLRPFEATYVFPSDSSNGFIRRLWHKQRRQQ